MLSILSIFVGPIFGMFKGWVDTRREIKVEVTKAKIARIQAAANMAGDADLAAIQAQRFSIKDEILMIIIMGPFVGVFIPFLQPYILNGFDILKTTPVWYQGIVIGICVSVFGLRFMINRIIPTRGGSK